eukprot:Phypoly_transcript_14312.p1 GENE.Phypoly_transcript_14312~~Phypoly_transcript_14312.p1  ORF type:complete len:254 (+),score=12.24 Phypoly_transcript_14312:162-923(+)
MIATNWLPGPVKNNLTLKVVEPHLCTFWSYSGWVMEISASMLNLLLAYTLYAAIVKRIDLYEMRAAYYYKFLAVFWIPTLAVPLVLFLEITHSASNGYCFPRTKGVAGVKLFAWFFPAILQVILMVPVFREVFSVTQAVRNGVPPRNSSKKGILWLCIRFGGAQCNQVLVWFPATVWQMYSILDLTPPYAVNIIIAISFGLPALNGFIVLAGNTPLWNSVFDICTCLNSWCAAKLSSKRRRFSSNSSELSEIT